VWRWLGRGRQAGRLAPAQGLVVVLGATIATIAAASTGDHVHPLPQQGHPSGVGGTHTHTQGKQLPWWRHPSPVVPAAGTMVWGGLLLRCVGKWGFDSPKQAIGGCTQIIAPCSGHHKQKPGEAKLVPVGDHYSRS